MDKGTVFHFEETNPGLPGFTISEARNLNSTVFSLGEGTEISQESYPVDSLLIGLGGKGTLIHGNQESAFQFGEFFLEKANYLLGKKAAKNQLIYLEWRFGKELSMNPTIEKGKVFALKDKVPYQDGKIVNLTVVESPNVQLAVLAMGKGCELPAHQAPGEALLLILDGEGIITYEGQNSIVKEGDSFSFAKGGLHAVKAVTNFKFALLLEKE